MNTNKITGDSLRSKPANAAYREGWDGITKECPDCGKKTPLGSIHTCSPQFLTVDEFIDDLCKDDPELRANIANVNVDAEDALRCFVRIEVAQPNPDWPEEAEARMDIVGQNGNDGLVYLELEQYK